MKRHIGIAIAGIVVLVASGCSRTEPKSKLSPKKMKLLEQAHSGRDVCAALGLQPDCDVCAEFGYYGDGICDEALIQHGLCQREDPDCGGLETDCTNGLDDDGNGLVDCGDENCAYTPSCWPAVCGDGILDPGEECDDGNTASDDGCDAQCRFEGTPGCGNGRVDSGEECDTDDFLQEATCESLGFAGGRLLCTPDCTIDTSECVTEDQEICDNGLDDDTDGLVDCEDPDCIASPACGGSATCGNGIVEPGEECDDGNTADGDGCDARCRFEGTPGCGNGRVDSGEECDTDDFLGATCESLGFAGGRLLCAMDCTYDTSECVTENQETCDNGIDDDADGLIDCEDPDCAADPACGSSSICGNGILEPGEECDDGNTADGDGCDAQCRFEGTPGCGNGRLDPGEECDDGNTVNGDGCDARCRLE